MRGEQKRRKRPEEDMSPYFKKREIKRLEGEERKMRS